MSKLIKLHDIQTPSTKILAVAMHTGANICAAGDREGIIHIIDLTSGDIVRKLKQHVGFVYALTFDPDTGHLISTGKDKSLRVWDVQTGQFLRDIAGIFCPTDARTLGAQNFKPSTRSHSMTVLSLACAKGKRMATGGQDAIVKLWIGGEPIRSFNWHTGPVTCVRFQPNTGVLFSASKDKTIRSWNDTNGAMLHKYLGHEEEIVGLDFASESHFLSTDAAGNVLVWRTGKESPLASLYTAPARASATCISPGGERLFLGLEDGTIVSLSLNPDAKDITASPDTIHHDHASAIRSLNVSDNGLMASADNSGKVMLWQIEE
ncbi:MAG: hypothetical protein FWC40_04615 [Proteobacteria bacterium]|nr:hypothetical protein [Pseudomonadota bacterium]